MDIQTINRLLHVDGVNVKARDVLDSLPREVLQNALSFIVAELETPSK